MKKYSWLIWLLSVAAILVSVPALVLLGPWDERLADASDLQAKPVAINPADNAFPGLEKTGKLVVDKQINLDGYDQSLLCHFCNTDAWDPDLAKEMLATNRQVFPLLEANLACKHYARPSITDFSTPVPWQSKMDALDNLLFIQSKLAQMEGDYAAATKAGLLEFRLGQLRVDDANCLPDWMRGRRYQVAALTRLEELVADAKAPETSLRHILQTLSQWNSEAMRNRGFTQAIQNQFANYVQSLADLKQGKTTLEKVVGEDNTRLKNPWLTELCIRSSYTFRPNASINLMARFHRELIADAKKPFTKRTTWPTWMNAFDRVFTLRSPLQPNYIGKLVYTSTCRLYTFPVEIEKLETWVSALRLKTALRLYELQHGKLPESLEALKPEFLQEVPMDPFAEKPFRYSKERRIVWASCPDRKENNGKADKGQIMYYSHGCDLVMPIGTREPAIIPPAK